MWLLSINMNGWLGRDILRCETYSGDPQSCMPFWLKIGVPLVFPFVMPPILSTELSTWRVVARRWRRGNRGQEAGLLSREERLASLAARGAYIESQWNQVLRAPDIPADWCRACGQWTTSWCEGCYARCGSGTSAFSAICHHSTVNTLSVTGALLRG